jgi:hypothetical protein
LFVKGHEAGHVSALVVETGIGPVFALRETIVGLTL